MANKIKLVSWNVNGIRSALKKGFKEFVEQENPDIICLQETKAHQDQVVVDLPNYIEYWNSAERKGYAGTAIFTKTPALKIINNIMVDDKLVEVADTYGDANNEGRVIVAEFEKFFVVSVYTPNAKPDLSRLDFRHKKWDAIFLKYMKELEKQKPVIFCGDFNVAHEEIDLARPDTNHKSHGFTDQEREGFTNIINAGFIDTYRAHNPEKTGAYTWWAVFGDARAKNVGWRIDYVCVSKSLKDNVKETFIRPEVKGSDHCPVGIVFEI